MKTWRYIYEDCGKQVVEHLSVKDFFVAHDIDDTEKAVDAVKEKLVNFDVYLVNPYTLEERFIGDESECKRIRSNYEDREFLKCDVNILFAEISYTNNADGEILDYCDKINLVGVNFDTEIDCQMWLEEQAALLGITVDKLTPIYHDLKSRGCIAEYEL